MDINKFTTPRIVHRICYLSQVFFLILSVVNLVLWINNLDIMSFALVFLFFFFSRGAHRLKISYNKQVVEDYNAAVGLKKQLYNREKRRKRGINR